MSRLSGKNWTEEDGAPRPRRGSWCGVLLVPAALALVLYGALLVGSRTEGFRALAEQRISAELGRPIRLERLALTPGLDVVFRGLKPAPDPDDPPPEPGVRAASGRMTLDGAALLEGEWAPRELILRDGSLVFRTDTNAVVHPVGLAAAREILERILGDGATPPRAAAAPSARQLREELTADRRPPRVELTGFNIEWRDAGGGLQRALRGADLYWTPLTAPGRTLLHLQARAVEMIGHDGRRIAPFVHEELRVGRRTLILTPPPAGAAQ